MQVTVLLLQLGTPVIWLDSTPEDKKFHKIRYEQYIAYTLSPADSFSFINGGNYQSDHSGASGVVGNQKFSRQVFNRKYEVDNWKLMFTNRLKARPKTITARLKPLKAAEF